MERLKLGICGAGVLGHAMARGMNEHACVRLYDIVPEKSTHTLAEVAECEFIFVCVPTPCRADGRCETSIVEKAVRNLADEILKRDTMEQQAIVIRSTVPVGTTNRLAAQLAEYPELEDVALLHSPEFLTERCSLVDFQTPSRMLVGVPGYRRLSSKDDRGTMYSLGGRHVDIAMGEKLETIYQQRFPGTPCYLMDSDETEMAKLACNSFFGLKVAFFNAIHQWALTRGVAPEAVRDAILSDGRIAHAHTAVISPGGFGGNCLAKDSANAFYGLQEADLFKAAGIISAAWEWNKEIRQEQDPKLPRFTLRPGPHEMDVATAIADFLATNPSDQEKQRLVANINRDLDAGHM